MVSAQVSSDHLELHRLGYRAGKYFRGNLTLEHMDRGTVRVDLQMDQKR